MRSDWFTLGRWDRYGRYADVRMSNLNEDYWGDVPPQNIVSFKSAEDAKKYINLCKNMMDRIYITGFNLSDIFRWLSR